MKVLITPSGSEIGLEIFRSLKNNKNIDLVGANSLDDFSKHLYEHYISGIPYINDLSYIQSIKKIILLYNITHVFPAHDDACLKLKKFEIELGIKVVTSSFETNSICRSKRKSYRTLSAYIKTPFLFNKDDITESHFPLFIKPDVGQGSKGAYLISCLAELIKIKDSDLICEYLPGREYTIDCLTDSKGVLLYHQGRERMVIKSGISVQTVNITDSRFESLANQINENIRFQGAWFFQVKENSQCEFVLLEVAARIAGSMASSRVQGINYAELSLLIASDTDDLSLIVNKYNVQLDRALDNKYIINLDYNKVFVDFDDCIYIKGNLNYALLAFLYRCIDRKIKVTLISRHKGNLNKKLSYLRINNLFDNIIHITDDSPKSKYISKHKSIFIDDSFNERKEVNEMLGINCFSLDMIEVL